MRVIIYLAIILATLGCHKVEKEEEKKKVVICRSFEFSLEQSDWGKARKKMHSIAIDYSLPFSDDSDSVKNNIAYLQARIKSNWFGVQYVLSTNTYWTSEATKAKVSFYANETSFCEPDINNKYTYPYHELYEKIKNDFSKDWKIAEVNVVKVVQY